MRLLGIDFGLRRIGLAISDSQARFALPMATFERRNDRAAARYIARIIEQEKIEGLVIGEPININGSRGDAALRVRRFAQRLEQLTGLPIRFVNEALTSHEARQQLAAAGVDVRKNPHRIDSVAAQILLQDALDNPQPSPAASQDAGEEQK